MTMVQPGGPSTTPSFQPTGRMSTPNPSPGYPTNTATSSFQPAGIISTLNPSPGYPTKTATWVPLQTQWAGQPGLVPGQAQSHPSHQAEAHQLPYPGVPAYQQFYH